MLFIQRNINEQLKRELTDHRKRVDNHETESTRACLASLLC